jgi:hypothetical protein
MTEDTQRWSRRHRRFLIALSVLLVLVIAVAGPPLVSMSRYKARITHLMSESLGRPVRLSSVELRLLPVPGFVLTDLTVDDDPAFGAEPVLHANTVTASIRLMSLWRGRLEISTISVDEASLNVVRTSEGRWNLDPLFRTAAARVQPAEGGAGHGQPRRATPLPYLEATNSRINFKRGAEKLPFSLVGTDLSFWQENPGDWRIRLRGQPARTDVSLDLADTGLVRLEARAQRAPELRQMPLHVDIEWSEAQLGQLTRLLIGSDPGWRGDLTGELHLDGTADAAEIKTRLRATGVHRAEFAPAAPMDFDASCGFLYRFTARAVDHLACDSPLGDGRVHLDGALPGDGSAPHLSVELDKIPVAAGLDALRTVRSGFGPGLEAAGSVSGKITYAENTAAPQRPDVATHGSRGRRPHAASTHPAIPGPLTGSFTVEGFQLSGDGLSTPIQASRLVLEPAGAQGQSPLAAHSAPAALEGTVSLPAGGAAPLAVTARLALSGYRLVVHGQCSVARAKELAHVAGMADSSALASLAGEPVTVDLDAAGPWLPAQSSLSIPLPHTPTADAAGVAAGVKIAVDAAGLPLSDTLSATITLRNANWKADYLANHVEIAQAALHLDNGEQRWDPIVFSYGPVKGTASLLLGAPCAVQPCPAAPPITFAVHFTELNAGALQAAILGAHEQGTLLSSLIARLKPPDTASAPAWPPLEGTVKADSFILGPITLTSAMANIRIIRADAEIDSLEGDLLGGHVRGSGTLSTGSNQGKPAYEFEGEFDTLNPARVAELMGLKGSGSRFRANGKINLSGFTDKDLTASAKGTLKFEWLHGAITGETGEPSTADEIPAALARFDRWTAEAGFGDGVVRLKDNSVQQSKRKRSVEGTLTLAAPPKVSFTEPAEPQPKR